MHWFHKQLGDLVPEVFDALNDPSFSLYSMEYRDFTTFSDILIDRQSEEFFKELGPLISLLKERVYTPEVAKQYWADADDNYFEAAYLGRASRRLALMSQKNAALHREWETSNRLADTFQSIQEAKYLSINGVRYPNVAGTLGFFEAKKADFKPAKLVNFAHGDAYLGNIGLSGSGQITLFDLRGRAVDELIDPLYDFGKIVHTFTWDLICKTRAISAEFKDVAIEQDGEMAVIKLDGNANLADLIGKILSARRSFFDFLNNNHDFQALLKELGEDRDQAMQRIVLAEWVNLLSDIPNRIEDDPSGNMALAMYAVGAIMADEQKQELSQNSEERPSIEDVLLIPLQQRIFHQNRQELSIAQQLLAQGRPYGLIFPDEGVKKLLLDKIGSSQQTLAMGLNDFLKFEVSQPEVTQRTSWILVSPTGPASLSQHKVLVIGASGFLGKAIYNEFKAQGFDVMGTQTNKNVPGFKKLDLSQDGAFAEFLQETDFKPDTIIYAAGILADDAEQQPELSLRINVSALQEIRSLSQAKIVFFSSDQVFGRADKPPYFGHSKPSPVTNYGRHKAMAEALVANDSKMIAVRAGALYGFNDLDDKATFPTTVLKALIKDEDMVADDKREIFPFPVETAAKTILKLALANAGGFVCSINGDKTTYYDWAKLLQKEFGIGNPNLIRAGDMKKKTVRPQKAHMISIDTANDLSAGTVMLRNKLSKSVGSSRDYNLIPAPIDMSDSDFFSAGLAQLVEAGATEIELDAMDGIFTPDSKDVMERLLFIKSSYPHLKVRVHLMISDDTEQTVERYAAAGADIISLHHESFVGLAALLKAVHQIQKYGAQPALIFNADYKIETKMQKFIVDEKIKQVVIMGVTPGVRGQSFNPKAFKLIGEFNKFSNKNNLDLEIAVDGGLKTESIRPAAEAGATVFITWSMIAKGHSNLMTGFCDVYKDLQNTGAEFADPNWPNVWYKRVS